jgi:hypothetical protein
MFGGVVGRISKVYGEREVESFRNAEGHQGLYIAEPWFHKINFEG